MAESANLAGKTVMYVRTSPHIYKKLKYGAIVILLCIPPPTPLAIFYPFVRIKCVHGCRPPKPTDQDKIIRCSWKHPYMHSKKIHPVIDIFANG